MQARQERAATVMANTISGPATVGVMRGKRLDIDDIVTNRSKIDTLRSAMLQGKDDFSLTFLEAQRKEEKFLAKPVVAPAPPQVNVNDFVLPRSKTLYVDDTTRKPVLRKLNPSLPQLLLTVSKEYSMNIP